MSTARVALRSPTGIVHLSQWLNHHGPTLCGQESYSWDRQQVVYWPRIEDAVVTCKRCHTLNERGQGA